MARPKKDNRPVTVRMEIELYDRLNQFVADSGQPKTVAIERALAKYIDDYYQKQQLIRAIPNEITAAAMEESRTHINDENARGHTDITD